MNFELELLRRVLPKLKQGSQIVVPPGDDCAAIDLGGENYLLAASDQLISDVHYFMDRTAPEQAGCKLLKRNLSDIAAMGGQPLAALVNIAQSDCSIEYLERFFNGIEQEAERYGVSIIGGDLAKMRSISGKTLVSSLTILGMTENKKVALRCNANAGDWIFVTGKLGNSLSSGRHLNFQPRLPEGQFLVKNGFSLAMMDISDGLLLDLRRMSEASKLDAVLDLSKLPPSSAEVTTEQMLSDGEDYELLFAVPDSLKDKLLEVWPKNFAMITMIGRFELGSGGVFNKDKKNLLNMENVGYEH